jgi:predicted naringenin-chalcone synthase
VHRETYFLRDTLHAMGFRVRATGFHMVLDPGIPKLLADHLPAALARLLDRVGLCMADIHHFLVHPGGRRILDLVEQMLDRGPAAVEHSRRLLADFGNLSSVSVLALLHRFMQDGRPQPGERAVVVAFGPGFNAELLLLQWPHF